MERKGTALLPLHYGHPPEYLYKRMVKLGGILSDLILEKYGNQTYMEKLADPFWFHSLSLAIGFDWNSSGTTTATLSAIKEYFARRNSDVHIIGGKGKRLSEMRAEMDTLVKEGRISESKGTRILEDARRIARVDQSLLQDDFDLYMQFLVMDENGRWAIVQQGMNPAQRMARRYHWIRRSGMDFINDYRNGISSEVVRDQVLDLSTKASEKNRHSMVSLGKENPERYRYTIENGPQRSLDNFQFPERHLRLDYRIDWPKMRAIYEYQPEDFQELAYMKGVGKSTIRALSYLAELVYGDEPSFRDPVKFSFAVGGKDGVPKPINRNDYDIAISFFKELLGQTRIGDMSLESIAAKLSRSSFQRTS
ncbi:MAG: DUF763 domain-containing protein [Thermoplasmataceae archaeon]|jgi:hypothetical protein